MQCGKLEYAAETLTVLLSSCIVSQSNNVQYEGSRRVPAH